MNLHSDHAHLGDLQWSLNMLSRLKGEHLLCCKAEYVEVLRELVAGLPIDIQDCSHIPPKSFDCWIASGQVPGLHYRDDIDIMGFVQRYFNSLCVMEGYPPCFETREDMLCNFPEIKNRNEIMEPFTGILVVNCDPKSGQCPRYSSSEMDELVMRLEDKNPSVLAVEEADLSLVQIGALSINARLIVGCATGPWWPTMLEWNKDVIRIVLLEPMRLNYGPTVGPIHHAKDAAEAEAIMASLGFL